jgi:glycine/D-amino acid oxidase-like deaminating enzyme
MPGIAVDTLIVGQGLAGTVLAWQLRFRGDNVLVVDDPRPITASRIAAGLATPITGQRLVPSWRFLEFWPVAVEFYRHVERETGRAFFRELPMVRLFKSHEERERILGSRSQEVSSLVRFPEPLVDEANFRNPFGGFEMTGGQLDVPAFLEASRTAFESEGQYLQALLTLPEDLELSTEGVVVPRWNLKARRAIFCEGLKACENPWFGRLPFDAAKGEILTLRIQGLTEPRVIHRGLWLAPWMQDLFRAGATYDRDNLNDLPTPSAREEIGQELHSFLRLPFEVIGHHAAVRPIVVGRHPVIGMHPRFPQLGCYNGLASKGTLQAPFIAGQFADFLLGRGEIEETLNLQKRFGSVLGSVSDPTSSGPNGDFAEFD